MARVEWPVPRSSCSRLEIRRGNNPRLWSRSSKVLAERARPGGTPVPSLVDEGGPVTELGDHRHQAFERHHTGVICDDGEARLEVDGGL